MFVYVVQEFPSLFIKIGKSKSPDKRLGILRTSNPHLLELIGFIKYDSDAAAFKAETFLHQKYNNHRVRREWFRLDVNSTDLLREIFNTTSGIELHYHKRVFHKIPNSMLWSIQKLHALDSNPTNHFKYKRQMNTFRKVIDFVKENGSPDDLAYVKSFKPKRIDDTIGSENIKQIKASRKWLEAKAAIQRDAMMKSSKELFAEFVGQGSRTINPA